MPGRIGPFVESEVGDGRGRFHPGPGLNVPVESSSEFNITQLSLHSDPLLPAASVLMRKGLFPHEFAKLNTTL